MSRHASAQALGTENAVKESGFVFVIDEWDFPLRESDDERIRRAYLEWLRDLFKGAPYVDGCYMTGILPIRKYGKHSALNLFKEFSMTSPRTLERLIGFNADEVKRLCARFDVDQVEMIRTRNYPAALQGLSGTCVLVGITYHEGTTDHECVIERIEL